MGYVTQSRTLPSKFDLKWKFDHLISFPYSSSGDLVVTGYGGGFQTTTSFRTGRRAVGRDELEEDLLTSSSFSEFRSNLKREYKRDVPQDVFDNGHTFDTVKSFCSVLAPSRFKLVSADGRNVYNGPLVVNYTNIELGQGGSDPLKPVPPVQNFDAYGPLAIKRTIPTRSPANLATALGELVKDGIPTIVGSALQRHGAQKPLTSSADEYLNWQFGWAPIIGDLQDTLGAVVNSHELISQYERDSGRIVRRSCEFPEEILFNQTWTKNVDLYNPPSAPSSDWQSIFGLDASFNRGRVRMTQSDRLTRKVWFSGAYSYFLQQDRSAGVVEYVKKAKHLLGLEITPEVIYDLAPWTWLADWNFVIGDNIANATALGQDGLVIRWGYLMCQSTYTREITMVGAYSSSGSPLPPIRMMLSSIRKQRIRATPFGFGLNPTSFTGRQWSILAALGLTKSSRGLQSGD